MDSTSTSKNSNFFDVFILLSIGILVISWPFLRQIPKLFGVSISIILIAVASLFWIVKTLQTSHITLSRVQILGIIFASWTLLSYLWSVNRTETISTSSYKAWLLIMAIILVFGHTYRTIYSKNAISMAYIITGMSLSFGVIGNFLIKNSYLDTSRYTAFSLNPNVLGGILALILPLVVSYIGNYSTNSKKYYYLVGYSCLVCIITAVLLTGSRTAMIAIIPSILYYGYIIKYRVENRTRLALFALLTSGLIIIFTPTGFIIERFISIIEEVGQLRFGSRIVQWSGGMQLFNQQPLLGIGYGTFHDSIEQVIGYKVDTDNEFLGALYELGLIGFLILTTLVLTLLRRSLRSGKWLSFICCLIILMSTNDILRVPLIWVLLITMDVELSKHPR